MNKNNIGRTIVLVVGGLILIGLISLSGMLFENLDANHLMVIQSPTGNLNWHLDPGIKWQGFGHVTKYPKRDQFWFNSSKVGKPADAKAADDESIKVRFNDGGHAQISGSVSWDMPIDKAHLTLIHSKYGSADALEQQLIRTVVEKAVYMTGPLMSSAESYASRRNELLSLMGEQIERGIFRTTSRDEHAKDPLTGIEKTVRVVEIVRQNNVPAVESESPLAEFGIKTYNLSLNEIKYDETVEGQIKKQQEMTMQVQTAIAKAKAAEQDALTTEQEGKASAAKAKWEQETKNATVMSLAEQQLKSTLLAANMEKSNAMIRAEQDVRTMITKADGAKSNAIILAEQELRVAVLKAQAAEENKKAAISEGEGEGKRRQLIMEADGALEKRLAAWVTVNEAFAKSLNGYSGQLVPTVVMGAPSGGGSGSMANAFMDMLTVKTANDLALDMRMAPSRKSLVAATNGSPAGIAQK